MEERPSCYCRWQSGGVIWEIPDQGAVDEFPGSTGMDALKYIRELPDDILKDIGKIVVNRKGEGPQSYMITEDIVGHAAPKTTYRVTRDGLVVAKDDVGRYAKLDEPIVAPNHVRVRGTWDEDEFGGGGATDANILGGFGTLTLPRPVLDIPEAPASEEALAYYGARLVKVGDYIEFDTDSNLPVTIVSIGSTYVDQYLKVEEKGGGPYIEYHDKPHFHMPMDMAGGGHLILGRSKDEEYLFSAFRIPFGYAIYTSPFVLHADAFLVGRYLVVYSVTDRYSTVIFRARDRELVDVRITQG